MKNVYFLFFMLFAFAVKLQAADETIEQYYASAEGKTGTELRNALHAKISQQTVLSYTQVWDALKITDEDPSNPNNVILLYTGWSYPKSNNGGGTTEWNREHTWAKSMGDFGTSNGPGTDIHHLRPTDVTVNSKRGNLYFDNGGVEYTDASRYDGGSGATGCKYDGDSWEPRDEVKGDVARMLFYMAVRYEQGDMVDLELAEYSSSSGLHGKLSTLLNWHELDPVDDWETHRNDTIYYIQGNRNPFIDHPEYVDAIWGSGGGTGGGDDPSTEVLFSEDFETVTEDAPITLSGWTVVNTSGTKEWVGKNYNSNSYAQMTAYQGDAVEVDWLVTPPIDLTGKSDVELNFDSKEAYDNGEVVDVLISTDFSGDVETATWTELSAVLANGTTNGYATSFTNSGDVSLSAYSETVHIAFKYAGGTGLTTTMQIDNVTVTATNTTSVVNNNVFADIKLYPNPAKNHFAIRSDSAEEIKEVSVFNQDGRLIKVLDSYEHKAPINIEGLASGLYFVKITDASGYAVTKKLIIQ